jgi:aspartate carbamoyltransferase catalytic subunit
MPTRTFRSVEDVNLEGYLEIFGRADQLREQQERGVATTALLSGKWIACLFQGHSTRTRALMQAACSRLGATCTSENVFDKGYVSEGLETIEEALLSYSTLADVLVIRHDSLDLSKLDSGLLEVPVINAMCGSDEHSLAAIGRAYSIWRSTGDLSASTVGVYGWIPTSRPLKALIKLLNLFGTRIFNDPVLPKDSWAAGSGSDGYMKPHNFSAGGLREFLGEVDALFVAEGLQQKNAMPQNAESQYCRRFEHIGNGLLAKMKPRSIVSVGKPDILPDGSRTILPDAHSHVQQGYKMILLDWVFCTQALLCYLLGA